MFSSRDKEKDDLYLRIRLMVERAMAREERGRRKRKRGLWVALFIGGILAFGAWVFWKCFVY